MLFLNLNIKIRKGGFILKKNLKEIVITGFALFSMFFGAGNLIFPPTLGYMAGESWIVATFGFLITCISLPILGIISIAMVGGTIEKFTNKVGKNFGKILFTVIMLAIGPLFCIPRTGATTFELGVLPMFPNSNPIIFSIIFFGISYIFSANESKVVDKIGIVLTPILLGSLGLIIIKGIINPIGVPISSDLQNPFSIGFTEGYQTMDAIGSMIVAQMVIANLIVKGYKSKEQQVNITSKAGVVAAICLGLVYGGLAYIGATSKSVFPANMSRTTLLIEITQSILGPYSKYIFGGAISIACLTTSVGLTATCGNYFNKLSNNKISYKTVVLIISIFSCIISNYGVETIINLAVPVLVTLYPVVIILILLNLFNKIVPNRGTYIGAVYGALIVSVFMSLESIGLKIPFIVDVIYQFPLSKEGFFWIVPSLLGGTCGTILNYRRKNNLSYKDA